MLSLAQNQRPRVTVRQIAAQTGLSTFAVSRALAGKTGVSEETRRLVRQTAESLGYAPAHQGAKGHEIGMIFDDQDRLNSELQIQIQAGVQREARRLGQKVRVQSTHLPEQMLDVARASAGLLLAGPHDRATVAMLRATGVPMVRLGWVDPLEPVDQVIGADYEAGAAVAQYLLELGHRRIVYAHGQPGPRGRVERFHGLRDVASGQPGVAIDDLRFDETNGFADAFRAQCRERFVPTAVFCTHDALALTVVSELLAMRYRIPEDISVIGFGDFTAATMISPQLTTIRLEGAEMGATALRLLLDRIGASVAAPAPALRVLVAGQMVIRRSAAPPGHAGTSQTPPLSTPR